MKRIYVLIVAVVFSAWQVQAQSTNLRVYQIFQNKCTSCHGSNSPEAGLDLVGVGASENARAISVANTIRNQTPSNSYAAAQGYKTVMPGRMDQSHLFRKINAGIEPTLSLNESEEGTPCPKEGSPMLTDTEKEMIRQWILFGAPNNGTVVDEAVIEEYYTVGGLESFPDGPTEAPAPEEGFQVKMGPFFIPVGGEVEYFQKWQLELPADTEVNRLDTEIGTFSHHFLVYNFEGNGSAGIPEGLREFANHTNVSLIAAIQEPTDLRLPDKTAWRWDNDLILDLNAHYINYDAAQVYKAEVYMNVYTQDVGTAEQEMISELVVNGDIYIPNGGDLIVESQNINPNYPQGTEIFVWSMTGHTHQYGTAYKVWQRENFADTEMIYDGACPNGIPGCNSPFFDYQHIPSRYWDNLYPLPLSFTTGFRHEARYINDGDSPVWFGPTSDDEMMVMIMMYVTDTTGLDLPVTTNISRPEPVLEDVDVSPNPMTQQTIFTLPEGAGSFDFYLYDVTGQEQRYAKSAAEHFVLERNDLATGVYLYRIKTEDGRVSQGRLMVQ